MNILGILGFSGAQQNAKPIDNISYTACLEYIVRVLGDSGIIFYLSAIVIGFGLL